ncbi:MAG: hypothetical protein M3Z24_14080, partial [Chloroflexota bacterium]|nr:hypothetical protein [Chloroflexota bacterium]
MRIERSAETGVASRITLQSAFWARLHERLTRWLPGSFAGTVRGWLPQTPIVQDIAFHPYNGITGYTQGNGIATHKDFDIAGRLTAIKVGNEQSTFSYGVGPRIRTLAEQSKDRAP